MESLQKSLGIIEEKLDDIKKDTESIKDSTARIESKSDEMFETLDAIKDEIANAGAREISWKHNGSRCVWL